MKKGRGFTLVEVLACVLILALAATGVMSAFTHFSRISAEIGDTLRAAFILEWKLNDLRIQNVSNPFRNSGAIPAPPGLSAQTNEAAPELLNGGLSWQFRRLDPARFPGPDIGGGVIDNGMEVFIRIAWQNGEGGNESQSVFSIL